MKLAGGYVLHFDATHEGDSPALMTGLDGLSKMVLANMKVPSENADHIVPFLKELKKNYGIPKACVHDMGTGICKAVTTVFPGQPDYVCHFHFLRDIGKDFLEPAYRALGNRLRKYATSTLLNAIVREALQRLGEKTVEPEMLADAILSAVIPENETLFPLASTYAMASWCLRGKHSGDGYGFPFDRPQFDKLFADPIVVNTPNGSVTIYPQRTNNIIEQFFRDLKRSHRRRTGNNSMSRVLNSMLADSPLVKNLDNPEYMDMLLDGMANLEELFSEVERMQTEKDEKSVTKNDRILPGFKAIINLPLLPEYMASVFKKNQNPVKSNRVLLS